jgi:TorA maturation chaperone TorD
MGQAFLPVFQEKPVSDDSNLTLARENAYRLFAACFYVPDSVLLEDRPWVALAALLPPFSPDAAKQIDLLDPAALADEEALKVEHARLLIGPFALVAAPYGSVYLDKGRTVMGDSALRAQAFYLQHGFSLDDDNHEPPDHIAIELEFMSLLAFRERETEASVDAASGRKLVGAQFEFLRTFLLPFATPFTAAIVDDGEAPFYTALARGMLSFLEADAIRLASRIE